MSPSVTDAPIQVLNVYGFKLLGNGDFTLSAAWSITCAIVSIIGFPYIKREDEES